MTTKRTRTGRPNLVRHAAGVVGVAVLVAALTSGCSGNDGKLDRADVPVADVDRVEVRQLFPPSADEPTVENARQLRTPFGDYAVAVGEAGIGDAQELVSAISDAHFLDSCGVTFDMTNPDYEVVLLDGDAEVARLGYYREVAEYGECEVPGRWVDEDWHRLALTVDLPTALLATLG